MDKWRGSSVIFHQNGRVEEKNGGNMGDEDLFGDEDDELFCKISEDSILLEEELSQRSTHYAVNGPSTSTHVSVFGKGTPQSRPLEKLPHFDEEAGTTWIYPVNYPLRQYQYSMVEVALYKNTLISLPTGLGKTFIAAVVMYNFYRWYPTCKVVFMAPTKPLVAQQVEACFNIMGIPQEDISLMTGTLNPDKRTQQWTEKRVFFLTPQVLENDLSRGTCPAKLVRCLVLDEAHRALGNHAYCQVVRSLREHGHDFRILALSATPGSDMSAVRQVLTNLFISHVELRNEDSPDLQEYTFQRSIEKVVVPLGVELSNLNERFLKILRVYVRRLTDLQVLHTRDEKTLTKFQLLKSRECFRQNPPPALPRHRFGAVEGLFALCMTLYHAYELMMQHGIRSFYRFLKEILSNEKSHFFARSELRANEMYQSLMSDVSKKFEGQSDAAHSSKQEPSGLFSQIGSPRDSEKTPKAPFIISHPKMAKLLSIILEHHQKYAEEDKSTRVMVFSQYRDSVLEITEMLQQHHPLIKAMSFIGHNNVGLKGKGLTQKKQIQVVKTFREGGYNTLVSTCVGEEGLDIGDVDLIICYDAPKSPIRLVQRMGRTGRKREGRIVVLLTKGKEEQAYNASQYQKKAINKALGNTTQLSRYLVPNSPRMVPRGLSPSCLKLHMKAESWQTNTKLSKSSRKGQGSLLSMLSKASSSSSKKISLGPLMSQEDWMQYRKMRVSLDEVKTLPPPSLMCLKASKSEFDFKKHIDLSSYQPWQTLLQTTHLVGHSQRSQDLVELTEFILLQQDLGPEEDPYGLEMAAFLDKAYVEDYRDEPSPDFIEAPRRPSPPVSQEDGKAKKVKETKNTGGRKKKPKTVQGSLITDMFSRMAQSQAKNRQDNGDNVTSQSCSQNDKTCSNKAAKSVKNSNKAAEDDDDVVYLMDDDENVVQSSCVFNSKHQDDRGKQSSWAKVARFGHSSTKRSPEERQKSYEDLLLLLLPVPIQSSLAPDIEEPPQTTEFKSDEEIDEPSSPSEALEFCKKWRMENVNTNANVTVQNSAASHSKDMFEFTMLGKVPGAKEDVRDNCEQLQGTSAVFSDTEMSPIIRKSQCTKSKNMSRSDAEENRILTSPRLHKDAVGITSMNVSPVLGRSNTLQSSTPKTVSKHLFSGIATPGLATIEEFSPIPRNQNRTGTPGNLQCPSAVTGKRKREDECPENAGTPEPHDHRKRFRSKLSRFAKPDEPAEPEEPEVECVAEVSRVERGKSAHDMTLTKGSGKGLPKKLLYDEIPAEHLTSSWKPQTEDNQGSMTANAQSGEKSQHSVFKGGNVESLKNSEVTHEATNNNDFDTMEDCSYLAHIDELDLEPPKTPAKEKHEDSSSGLTVTQVLDLMQEKFSNETQNGSSTSFLKPSLNNSRNMVGNSMPAPGRPSGRLSLSRRKRQESKANSSDESADTEASKTSPVTQMVGILKKSPNKTLSNLPKDNYLSPKKTTDPRNTKESHREKHVSFGDQVDEEFMSESLFADVDFELDIPETSSMQTRKTGNINDTSKTHLLLPEDCGQGTRTPEKSIYQANASFPAVDNEDSRKESSKLLSPSQETQLFVRRKRKMCNVVGSDHDDSFASSDTEKDTSRGATTSDSSRTSSVNTCVAVTHDELDDDDDDCDFVQALGPPLSKRNTAKRKKKKKKRFEYLDDEAELSKDVQIVSSDESEDEEIDYDRSFVDDGTYLSQDNQQDMKAVYLRSVVSPVELNVDLNHRPALKYINDFEDSEDEELDNFVVDNSFVEYETEYVGTEMLAEDPIIQQALLDREKTKKTKNAPNENKAKRKRIVTNESSSDEDTGTDSKRLIRTPAKNVSCIGGTQPSHQDKNSLVESHGRNVGAVANNRNHQSCSEDDSDDSQELGVMVIEPEGQISKKFLPISNGNLKLSANTVLSQTQNPQEMSSTFGKPLMNSVVKDQHLIQGLGKLGMEAKGSGAACSTVPIPVVHKSSSLPKEDSRRSHNERLDTSLNAVTGPSPTTSPVGGCPSTSSISQLNTSDSFFVSSVPCNRSLISSQNVSYQEAVGVLVDTSEVQSVGNLLSCLRLRYGAQTAVVSLKHAHYAVSTRMAITRLSLAVFSNTQLRSRLIERVQGMLELYQRPVIIVETEAARGSPTPKQAIGRSRYLDTIVCACAQITRLKLLYSKSQEETSLLLWQLLLQEKSKGFKISTEPSINMKRQQMVTFYLSLPSISYPTAVAFAQNFKTIKEFLNSSPECMMQKGSISIQKATAVKQHIMREYREDMVVT